MPRAEPTQVDSCLQQALLPQLWLWLFRALDYSMERLVVRFAGDGEVGVAFAFHDVADPSVRGALPLPRLGVQGVEEA